MADSFVHTHCHSEFSMLDGAARVDEMVAKAASDGQPAMAVTDHGVMYGILDFLKACNKHGVKGIPGIELYMVDDRHDRTTPKKMNSLEFDSGGETASGKLYYHLTAMAENNQGYRNLIQLSSKAYLEGYYYKARVDWELLEQHHEGVIATTGCLGGMVLQEFMKDDYAAGLFKASRLKDIFGRDNLFVELQDHGIPEQIRTNPMLIKMAKELNLPLLAANDSHYVNQCDHKNHDSLLCLQTGAKISDTKRFKFHGDQHYVKTAYEMRELFSELPEACDNTLWIAERSNVDISDTSFKLPKFPLPDGFSSAAEYLTSLVSDGAKERWGDNLSSEYTDRLSFELSVIEEMGFSDYFLIVWDLVRYERSCGMRPGPGRGSAAGAAVAYALRITDIDPIKYDLLFERFLNPSRISMPDIDLDVDSRFREELIRYTREKYGDDRVCQIITYSQIKARSAVRDAARVLDKPYLIGTTVAKLLPPIIMGRDTPLAACFTRTKGYESSFNSASDLRELYESDDEAKEIIDVARGLEGLRKSDGIHAAAVVIADRPLTDILPVQKKSIKGKPFEDSPLVSQYDMHGVEGLGLLKMDFLGLRTLDVISDTVAMIKKVHGVEVDIDNPPMDDPKTYRLLQNAQTTGIFQLESSGIKELISRLKPTDFNDIAALVALYRPGPMDSNMHNEYADCKNGRAPVVYLHEDAKEILQDTQGKMIYQESMMRIAQKFAGYSLAEADNLRKATGKKLPEVMAAERDGFVERVASNGYSKELGTAWFDIIEPFAGYSFNKSHAVSYGFISFQTAYLKAHYPIEYLACLMTSQSGKIDKVSVLLNECRLMGIEVLSPDVNKSQAGFVSFDGKIPFGLAAVKNVGSGLVDLLVAERETNGEFKDFFDFCERVDIQVLKKDTMESLIKAGGFDSLGHTRKGLLMIFENIIATTVARRKKESVGQFDLFSTTKIEEPTMGRINIPSEEFEKGDKLRLEKEMVGLYISDHPLKGLEAYIDARTNCSIDEIVDRDAGTDLRIGGIVTSVEVKHTKKGDVMATFILEDLVGSIEIVVFPKVYTLFASSIKEGNIVTVEGNVDASYESRKILAGKIVKLQLAVLDDAPMHIQMGDDDLNGSVLEALKEAFLSHAGNSRVYLNLDTKVLELSEDYNVLYSPALVRKVNEVLGRS